MNFLKLRLMMKQGKMQTFDVKQYLHTSRVKLKKIALLPETRADIHRELTEICNEIYDMCEIIPGNDSADINNEIKKKIVNVSERIEKLKGIDICCENKELKSELRSAFSSIVSQSVTIKQHFQTQAISAVG